jgi:predicted DNA-binding mobile mystery protein A
MAHTFDQLRLNQISRNIDPFLSARGSARPLRGWIAAMREVTGLSLRAVATKLGTSYQLIAALEKSEANDRISLRKLREVASAMDCDLVYALVPRVGSIQQLAEARFAKQAEKRVQAVEHSMVLEDQGVGNVDDRVKEEINKLRRK